MFTVTERWKNAHANAMVAVLVVREATNVREHPELEKRKRTLEADLATRFCGPDDIKAAAPILAYTAYYKRFEKTYHLVQQLKTVALKRRPLPTVSGLVDVMFMAEMEHLLLTAGHDLAAVVPPVRLDAGTGVEEYVKMNEQSQVAKAGDMMVIDSRGILSSIIHGPDLRSRLTLETRDAMYVVYGPAGITRDDVARHLGAIRASIQVFSPSALFEPARILSGRGVEEMDV